MLRRVRHAEVRDDDAQRWMPREDLRDACGAVVRLGRPRDVPDVHEHEPLVRGNGLERTKPITVIAPSGLVAQIIIRPASASASRTDMTCSVGCFPDAVFGTTMMHAPPTPGTSQISRPATRTYWASDTSGPKSRFRLLIRSQRSSTRTGNAGWFVWGRRNTAKLSTSATQLSITFPFSSMRPSIPKGAIPIALYRAMA